MKIFGNGSVIAFLRFCAQLMWAFLLIYIVGQVAMLVLFLYSGGGVGSSFPVYLDSSPLTSEISHLIADDSAIVSSKGSIPMEFIPLGADLLKGTLLALFQIGLTGLGLYGFTVLKRVLNAMYQTDTFTPVNGLDVRRVGILLLIAAPLKFLFEWTSGAFYSSHVISETIISAIPPFDFTLLFAGLACFVIAEILNQAALMHEEQKLTV